MRACALVALFCLSAPAPVLMPSAASAASFDCAAARTGFETAICADPALGAADVTLATAYATALGGLSEEARAVMRAGQRDWLAFAEAACIGDDSPISVENRGDCLAGLFRSRIATLEASRMLGGYRFYLESHYTTLPDPYAEEEPDWRWRMATHEVAVPRLDGGEDADGFNTMIDAFVAEIGLGRDEEGALDGDESSSTELSLVPDTVTDARIALEYTYYWYGHGAAHGNYTLGHVHYLKEQGREIEAADLFAAGGWEETLAELTAAALEAEHGDTLFDGYAEGLETVVIDPRRWDFSDRGLVIRFQPYEVAAYAYGAPTATVSWDAIEPLLSETGNRFRWDY